MRFNDLFILSTRMFKARTSRTLLTILGMSVGIGAILFLVSLGYGLQNTLLEKITTADSLLTLDVTRDKSQAVTLDKAAIQKIKEIPEVSEVSPMYQLSSLAKMDELTTNISASIIDPLYLKLGSTKVIEGKLINTDDVSGVIVSTSVAQIFGKAAKEIVDKPMSFVFFKPGAENSQDNLQVDEPREEYISNVQFKVVGVVESDESLIYINSSALSEISPPNFNQIKVKCLENKVMAGVQEKIMAMGFSVSSISETVDQANKIFRVIKIILMLFGIIALVVSAIGMFNTMTIALLERTEEIGIMKSIGASDKTISMIFVMESTIMGFLGGLAGILIGWLEGETFNIMINLIATHFGGEKVDLFYSPSWFILSIIIFSALVGFVTGVVPARRASQIDPLEALRYK